MAEADPGNVSAWIGLGFVDRASFRRADADAAYRQALAVAPGNAEAIAGLEELRWDRQGDVRLLGGVSSHPGVSARGEARVDAAYALDPRLRLSGGYQRYAYGAATPITGGGALVGTRTEDSLEGGVVFRPSNRTTLGASLYTFFGAGVTRGIVWIEGVRKITSRVSLIGNLRPAFSNSDPAMVVCVGPRGERFARRSSPADRKGSRCLGCGPRARVDGHGEL